MRAGVCESSVRGRSLPSGCEHKEKEPNMRRVLGWSLVLMLLIGGAVACGDDDSGGNNGTTTTTASSGSSGTSGSGSSGTSGSGSSGSSNTGNADLDAYCNAVAQYVNDAQALADDPTNSDLQNTVTSEATDL